MTEKIEVAGVIVFCNNTKSPRFIGYLTPDDFEDGVFTSDYSSYTLICEHTIRIDAPKVDLITPQINALDRKLDLVREQYQQAVRQIEVEKNNLLAITMEEK